MFNPVTFVSLGPGDPELITLKGLRVLHNADMIFCPFPTKPTENIMFRALNILLELGINKQKINLFAVPMSKNRSEAIDVYKSIAADISEHYKKGYKIAVVAEGDAGFYSSIYYISDNLEAMDISVKRIAGVPAFIACGSLANIHIAKQEEELNVVPGLITLVDLKEKIMSGKSVVIMKPSLSEKVIKDTIDNLTDVTVHYFENVGIIEKEFYSTNKAEITDRKFPYFSLLIIRN